MIPVKAGAYQPEEGGGNGGGGGGGRRENSFDSLAHMVKDLQKFSDDRNAQTATRELNN